MDEAGVTLLAHDIRALATLPAAEYRKMIVVWRDEGDWTYRLGSLPCGPPAQTPFSTHVSIGEEVKPDDFSMMHPKQRSCLSNPKTAKSVKSVAAAK